MRGETLGSSKISDLCDALTISLVGGAQAVALRKTTIEESTSRQIELNAICISFCLLSLELSCQKWRLSVMSDVALLAEPFWISSSLHTPHLSMGLDDDNTKFDNVLPHAIIVPAVQIFGDASGNSLDQPRIVSRSIVLIYDQASLDMALLSTSNPPQKLQQTSERRPAPPGVSEEHYAKRRKLSSERTVVKDGSGVALTSKVTRSVKEISLGGEQTTATGDLGVFTDTMRELGEAEAKDCAKTHQEVIMQSVQVPSTPTDPDRTLPEGNTTRVQRLGNEQHQRQGLLENKKRKVTISN